MKASVKKQLLETPYMETINKQKYTGIYMEARKIMIDNMVYLRAVIYIDGEAVYIIMCDKVNKSYCTYIASGDTWSKSGDSWSSAMIINLPEIQHKNLSDIKYINAISQTVGQSYFNDVYDTAQCIREWQMSQKMCKARERFENGERRTKELMEQVGDLPKDFIDFAEKTAFADFRYLYYESEGKKDIRYFCSCCRHEGMTTRPKGKGQLINKTMKCPHCGKKVIIKSMNRAPWAMENRSVAYIQRISDGLIARIFLVRKRYTTNYKNKPEYLCFEEQRIYIDKRISHYEEKETCGKYFGKRKTRWKRLRERPGRYWFPYVYTDDLKRQLKGTRYQYCALAEYARHFGRVVLEDFFDGYKNYKILESIIKIGLWNMAFKIVNEPYGIKLINGKSKVTEALGVKRCDLLELKKINPTSTELDIWKKIKENKWKDAAEEIKAIRGFCGRDQNGKEYIKEDFIKVCKYVRSSKLIIYLKMHKNPKTMLNDWLDYICAAEKLGYNLKDTAILFPKNFKSMHDRTIESLKIEENKIYEEEMMKRYEEMMKRYAYESDGFLITIPQKPKDLIREGKELKHCVGGYIERVARGQCTILFIREATHPDKPFCTAEVRGENCIQIRAYKNDPPTPETLVFWEEYKNKVLNKLTDQRLREAV